MPAIPNPANTPVAPVGQSVRNTPSAPSGSARGLLRVVSNTDLLKREDEAREARTAAMTPDPVIDRLAAHVKRCWHAARDDKNKVYHRLLDCKRRNEGKYSPGKLAEIRSVGGSEIYMRLAANKARLASGWLRDVFFGQNEQPWSLRPTPVADIPPDLVQTVEERLEYELQQAQQMGVQVTEQQLERRRTELRDIVRIESNKVAKERAERMERHVNDKLKEGGFERALHSFTDDIAVYPTAFMKGPIVRRKRKMAWKRTPTGQYRSKVTMDLCLEYERVSPFSIYPSPYSTAIDDGYLIELHDLTRRDLLNLIGAPGYSTEAIRAVLREGATGGLSNWVGFDLPEDPEDFDYGSPDAPIQAVEYWGSVQGAWLREWGMEDEEVEDVEAEYDVCVWLIGNHVIKATLNYDPLGRKPYSKASYEEVPGSFWGRSLIEALSDITDVCNACARSLVNNMAIASGPQVDINIDRLPAGETITKLHPWKIWQTVSDPVGNSGSAVKFFQPNPMADVLLGVYEKFSAMADEYSGLPRYMSGMEKVTGAGRTASGLAMLMTAANRTIKQVVLNIDIGVVYTMLERTYNHVMRYDKDNSIKGDVNIVPKGAVALSIKEAMQLRRNEFLTATANPIDMQILGKNGRAALLREAVKGLDMDVDDVIPSEDQLRMQQLQDQMMQQGQPQPQPQPQPPMGQGGPAPNGEVLGEGTPVSDFFSPNDMGVNL